MHNLKNMHTYCIEKLLILLVLSGIQHVVAAQLRAQVFHSYLMPINVLIDNEKAHHS